MRAQLSKEDIGKALDQVIAETLKRLKEQGDAGFASRHEALGLLAEKYHELYHAVGKDRASHDFIEDCLDVAVVCVLTVATLNKGQPSSMEG